MVLWFWLAACGGADDATGTAVDTAVTDGPSTDTADASRTEDTGDSGPGTSTGWALAVDAGAWTDAPVPSDFFFVPKTQEALDGYLSEARPGRRARLIVVESAFNYDPAVTDLPSAIAAAEAYVDAAADGLGQLSDHDTLLFPITKMPPWLSSSDDCSVHSVDDGWLVCQTVGPRDGDQWEALVEATVRRLTEVAPNASMSFEVWNEPDLYWTGPEADLLELYTRTVAAVHRVDPTLPVGGFGTNQPDGRVPGSERPLVEALAEHVASEQLPLDFVSVHVFGDHPSFVHRGMDVVDEALADHGLASVPVWITEFNDSSAYRGSDLHAAGFASLLGAFADRGVDARFMATWHDFDEVSDDGGYGLYRYDMSAKPVVAVHDALRAVDAQPEAQWQTTWGGTLGMAVGRGEGVDAVVWNLAADPVMAAVEALLVEVDIYAVADAYGTDEAQLVADLEAGTTHEPSLAAGFAAAADAWDEAEARQATDTVVTLTLGPLGDVSVARLDQDGSVSWTEGADELTLTLPPHAVVHVVSR